MFHIKVAEKIKKKYVLCSITFFEYGAGFEIMRKNIVEPDMQRIAM